MAAQFTELVIDCADVARVAEFWAAVLDYSVLERSPDGIEIGAADGSRPTLVFVPVPEEKRVKNRVHIDVAPFAGDDQAAEVARLVDLGARPIDVGQGEVPWAVLADPQGNELCVLTPR